MTVAEAKSKLIAWVKGQVGYTEGANNWNKYAVGKASVYGWDVQGQPWCDVFTDAAFIECFGLDAAAKMTYQTVGVFSALCRQSAQFFKDNGAFFQYPEPGDIIFLIYEGAINHQGIVTDVAGGVVYTVEGNSSDRVRSGAYATGASNIAGYGRPKWSIVASNSTIPATTGGNTNVSENPTSPKKCTVFMTLPVLEKGCKGEWVKILQQRLLSCGQKLPRWGADGDFGEETLAAVEAQQKERNLTVDGVAGQATWKTLEYKG